VKVEGELGVEILRRRPFIAGQATLLAILQLGIIYLLAQEFAED